MLLSFVIITEFYNRVLYAHALINNSYLPVIGVHASHAPQLLADNYCVGSSSLAYFMTQPLPIAGKLPTKTLVVKQLPTIGYVLGT